MVWDCKDCTMINKDDEWLACDMCGHPRAPTNLPAELFEGRKTRSTTRGKENESQEEQPVPAENKAKEKAPIKEMSTGGKRKIPSHKAPASKIYKKFTGKKSVPTEVDAGACSPDQESSDGIEFIDYKSATPQKKAKAAVKSVPTYAGRKTVHPTNMKEKNQVKRGKTIDNTRPLASKSSRPGRVVTPTKVTFHPKPLTTQTSARNQGKKPMKKQTKENNDDVETDEEQESDEIEGPPPKRPKINRRKKKKLDTDRPPSIYNNDYSKLPGSLFAGRSRVNLKKSETQVPQTEQASSAGRRETQSNQVSENAGSKKRLPMKKAIPNLDYEQNFESIEKEIYNGLPEDSSDEDDQNEAKARAGEKGKSKSRNAVPQGAARKSVAESKPKRTAEEQSECQSQDKQDDSDPVLQKLLEETVADPDGKRKLLQALQDIQSRKGKKR
eukprot:m.347243 g.347243  ORF g.347243 m.347243 type:complete len:441 (-) comp31958_c0_seq1:144-1466(-)